MNLPQTSRSGADFASAGERKATADKEPSAAAYTDIYDWNAPRRQTKYLEAHHIKRRKGIFDRRMERHAPHQWRVGVERRCRVLTTRQPCRRKNNKILANYQNAPDPAENNEKTDGEKTSVSPFTVQ